MQVGLGNVSALEARCASNFSETQDALNKAKSALLSMVERSFGELERIAFQRAEEIKAALAQARRDIEQLIMTKKAQLSPEQTAICEGLSAGPLFCLALEDIRLPIVEVIMTRCQLLPSQGRGLESASELAEALSAQARDLLKAGKAELAEQAGRFAESMGAPALSISASEQRDKAARKLPFLLSSTASSEEKQEAIIVLQRQAKTAREACLYPRCLKKLEKVQSLQSLEAMDCVLCLELGRELTRSARFTEADKLLRAARYQTKLRSSLSISLGNAIAEVYYQSGMREGAIEAYQWINGNSRGSLETLHFLTNSYYWLGRYEEGVKASQTLMDQPQTAENRCAQMCIQGGIAQIRGDLPTAVRLYEEALSLQVLRNSYLSCCLLRDLAVCYESQQQAKALELYLKAVESFACHYPLSYDYVKCLCYLGDYHRTRKQDKEAETQYLEALKVLSVHYPHTLDFPLCLTSLGRVYAASSKQAQAEEQWMQAYAVFENYHPQSLEFASCLFHLGVLYSTQKLTSAEDMWLRALAILNIRRPGSLEMAGCLNNLGALYEAQGRKQEAKQRTEEGLRLYQTLDAQKQVAASQARLKRIH